MIVRFPIESGCQYPRLTMKLSVVFLRVSRKKIAFFFSIAWCRPPEIWKDGKGLDLTKQICPTFWQLIYPPLISLYLEGEVADREGSPIGNFPLKSPVGCEKSTWRRKLFTKSSVFRCQGSPARTTRPPPRGCANAIIRHASSYGALTWLAMSHFVDI